MRENKSPFSEHSVCDYRISICISEVAWCLLFADVVPAFDFLLQTLMETRGRNSQREALRVLLKTLLKNENQACMAILFEALFDPNYVLGC